jgi:uncharacterized membrane protein YoaK (UPF0700 family)
LSFAHETFKLPQFEEFRARRSFVATAQKSVSVEWGLAGALALVSGYVDSYALMNFGVFASFMSGNTTTGGAQAGHANFAAAGHDLLPIPFFVLGIFFGTLIPRDDQRRPLLRRSIFVALLLSLAAVAGYWKLPGWPCIVLLSVAMGILNTSITQVGAQNVSLGFVTGDLNGLGQHLALGMKGAPLSGAQNSADTHWWRATVLATIWSAFLIGAFLGSAMTAHLAMWALLLPCALLLAVSLLATPGRTSATSNPAIP